MRIGNISKIACKYFKWKKCKSKFDEDFVKNYDENSNTGYILEVDVEYPRKLLNLHRDLPSLAEKLRIKKCNKLLCISEEEKKYVVYIRTLKQALNHGLVLRKVHRVIQFNQKAWWKPYIEMNTKLRTEAKNDFQKHFFQINE